MRRRSLRIETPLHRDGSVILKITSEDLDRPTFFEEIGCKVAIWCGRKRTIQTADALWIDAMPQNSKIVAQLAEIGIPVIPNFTVAAVSNFQPFNLFRHREHNFYLFRPTRSPVHETRRLVEQLQSKQQSDPFDPSLRISLRRARPPHSGRI